MLTDLSLIRYPGLATLQETQALRAEQRRPILVIWKKGFI